ncbi:putative acid phosphatase [Aspergillus clavatus NRRL 1]|uniref:Uncharacterized protein n=1 Tax=Aspergillus clavatus (strain ATCC 1007 / CBS 513.65 / DSM 816 / NCTC 3887 / NRRL 1 / QM 1276 / 107) TaxID=344612 RepID=A1C9A3_ASPCL|nr:uncharacterized protein ACLA_054740 [Aspergillus clavatus NRRL 1]EAW13427.1 hypothetical protein ACLA_054740 [Aspergillus clavatus NRRL 1]
MSHVAAVEPLQQQAWLLSHSPTRPPFLASSPVVHSRTKRPDTLKAVKDTYKHLPATYNYSSPVSYDAVSGNSVGAQYSRKLYNPRQKNGKNETRITQ